MAKNDSNKLLAELYVSCVNFFQKDTEYIIKMYCIKRKRILNDIKFHQQEEPLKFFRSKHKQWEIEKKQLEKELDETDKIISHTIDSLEESQSFLSFK